ncbi:MAG: mandelate racemase/muconate lactonizing enzyme family protein [Gemmatimonadetes bacterium]|jgi:galactonate dehydratase|nr:mandelate racemase/muconate lactonizing enzyme family protein [Gemmatimonadota bacterium]
MSKEVEDRGSSIRVTALHTIPVGAKGYVKLETNMGVVGWGEINNMNTPIACALAESMAEIVVSENPTRTEHLWQRMFRSHRNLRGGGLMTHVISGIDMALWDICGKLHGVPVYRLLGGPCRDKVWMYPSPKAIKISPGGPKYHAGTPVEVQELVQRVRDAREKVGPDGAVMVDAHSCLPPPLVRQFAGYLKSDDLLFLEEAWVPGNIEVMRRVREEVPVPLATGERDRTIWEVREILEAQVIDILQPDCGHGGGISQMRKVAALAEAHHVPIAPHCTMSYLGLTASLHVAASVPFFLIHEGYKNQLPEGVAIKTWEMDDEGYVSLPEGPGLGVEIDEQKAIEVGKELKRQFKWPDNRLRDGSVADY